MNGFWKWLFNGTVYVEFRVYFAMAMYETHIFLLCETSIAFIGAFCYSKIHFHPSGPFKLINLTMLKSLHVLLGSDLGSITLKCNALHYNYFQNHYITITGVNLIL